MMFSGHDTEILDDDGDFGGCYRDHVGDYTRKESLEKC
jgi:hypothetical protein